MALGGVQEPNVRVNKWDKTESEKAFNLARRCVGIFPITTETAKQHTEACNSTLDNSTRIQMGGAFATRDFLCKEMGMSDYEADNVRILRTFRLPDQISTLFVEFAEESDLRKVRSKVSNLRNGEDDAPKLTAYIPNSLQAQYSRVVSRANKGRAKTPRQASKIWVGLSSFELRFRQKGDFTPWNKIQPDMEPDSSPQMLRQSLISERALLQAKIQKPGSSDNNIWLVQEPTTTPVSPMTNFINNSDNPNFIPVTKGRRKSNLLGKTLLPKSVITSNSFQPIQRTEQMSP